MKMWPFLEWKKTREDPAWLAVVAPESTEGRVAGEVEALARDSILYKIKASDWHHQGLGRPVGILGPSPNSLPTETDGEIPVQQG